MADSFPMWAVVVVLGLSVGVAVALGPRVRRLLQSNEDESAAANYGYLITPAVTLSTLLLSFTLVTVWASYQNAIERAADEAIEVHHVADTARMLPGRAGRDIAGAITCYARSIAGPEWSTMAASGTPAAEVGVWTGAMDADVSALLTSTAGQSALAREILTSDRQRSDARNVRLQQSRASIPWLVTVLLVAVVALSLVGMGFALIPATGRGLQIGTLIVIAALFAAALAMIAELDSPFRGLVAVEPVDITRVAESEAANFAERYPGSRLPCDESGAPTEPSVTPQSPSTEPRRSEPQRDAQQPAGAVG